LQRLFGPAAFTIVPLLCPDPCGAGDSCVGDDHGALREFAVALRDLIKEDSADTLVVAGADFSHVGANFGDDRALDEAFLELVRNRDRDVLSKLGAGDPEGFIGEVARERNSTRICSAGCMFVNAVLADGLSAEVLGYHQAVDQETQCCVTCAAVAYTDPS